MADEGSTVARDLTGRSSLASVGDSAVLVLDSAQDEVPAETAAEPARGRRRRSGDEAAVEPPVDPSDDETLPADAGEGHRVVFSEDRQRVWLVDADGSVARTYLVSGSLYDNLDPGTYEVYSRSEQAYAFDGSGT